MSLNEFGVVVAEITEHSEMENSTAKSYLVLVTKLMAKVLYLLFFQTMFWRPKELMNMLNQILDASLALERYVLKSTNWSQKLLYIYVGILFFGRVVVHIIWFTNLILPDPHTLETFAQKLYKALINRFRSRFFMNVSTSYSYYSIDYVFVMCEVWVLNVSALIWIFWDVIVAAILPITFQVTVRKFEEVIRSHNLNDNNYEPSEVPVLETCRLFGMLKSMSESINKVWGNICLVLVLYRSTTYAVNMNGWNTTEDVVVIIETTLPFVSLCLLLFFSGDVYCKVNKLFKYL